MVDTVQQVLAETSLDPAALVLEVTEGTVTEDLDVGRTLQRLRDSGVVVAIDDFGTGYSSLARLRDLPADHVRLDKSFLADLDDDGAAPVAAAAVTLAPGVPAPSAGLPRGRRPPAQRRECVAPGSAGRRP
ncbi:hypothetical protein BH24ACT11_BH24ACT11_03100 [soil metagenome]